MKRCCRCRRHLELSAFGRHRGRADGLSAWCRDCRRRRPPEAPVAPDVILLPRGRTLRVVLHAEAERVVVTADAAGAVAIPLSAVPQLIEALRCHTASHSTLATMEVSA